MKTRTRPPFRFHHPRLETLEQRLPPGDALLGLWFGLPGMERRMHFNAPLDTHADSALTWLDDQPIVIVEAETALPNPRSALRNLDRPQESTARDDGTQTSSALGAATPRVIASTTDTWRPISTINAEGMADGSIRAASVTEQATRLPFGFHSTKIAMNGVAAVDQLPHGRGSETSQALDDFGGVPLTFEANHGQTDASVDFIARTGGGTVFVTPTALVMALPGRRSEVRSQRSEIEGQGSFFETQHSALSTQHSSPGAAIHMQIVGANPDAQPTGVNRQLGIVNYFIGNDPNQWHANIPTFGGVQYDDVYPGIDLVYYGNNGQLEYDFIVSPGADPNAITLNFAGAGGVDVNRQGDLIIHTPVGDVVQQKPFTYQDVGDMRKEVPSAHVIDGTQVQFEVGTYDATRPLVIDPLVLGYSTFLGGSLGYDSGYEVKSDVGGHAYVTGATHTSKFPVTPGAYDTTHNGGLADTFVAKLNTDGSSLVYATFLGGSSSDEVATGIALDDDGNAYVAGLTQSPNFPTTAGAYDTTYNGSRDGFVAKLNASGSALIYSTYLGTPDQEGAGAGIEVDNYGNVFVSGTAWSSEFPTTAGAFDTTFNGDVDGFVAELNADGSTLLYSTYLGGSDFDVAQLVIDNTGAVYASGQTESPDFPTTGGAFDTTYNGGSDVFVVKFSPDGSALEYATFLGGSGYDNGVMAISNVGEPYVTGLTNSGDFPTIAGGFDTTYNGGGDGFIAKFNSSGSALTYSTYVGGSVEDSPHAIGLDGGGNAYIAGLTRSANFPTTPDTFDATYNGGYSDAFLAKVNPDGSVLVYATYLGGSGDLTAMDSVSSLAVSNGGDVYLTGWTYSRDFPTTPGALKRRNRGESDSFVTKFAEV